MSMYFVSKAMLDTVIGANANREDLTNVIYLTDGPARPLLQSLAHTHASNVNHQWREIGLNVAGRHNVAGGGATYAEAGLPNANQKSPTRPVNSVARIGRLAQVSDDEMACFNGGGQVQLAQGEMERMIQDAMDFAAALVGIECMNQTEWMHITGDATNATMEGGEFNGILAWATAGNGASIIGGGVVGIPVQMQEQYIVDGGRATAKQWPTAHADTLLIPPEIAPDINSYVRSGSARPLVQIATGDNSGYTAGVSVNKYNDGYQTLSVELEPYLSGTYNTDLGYTTTAHDNGTCLGIKKSMFKQADLIPFGAAPLARTDTSLKRLVNWVGTQEHSVAKHVFVIPNVYSAIA